MESLQSKIAQKHERPPAILGGRSRLEIIWLGCQTPNVDKAPPRVHMAMVIRRVIDTDMPKPYRERYRGVKLWLVRILPLNGNRPWESICADGNGLLPGLPLVLDGAFGPPMEMIWK